MLVHARVGKGVVSGSRLGLAFAFGLGFGLGLMLGFRLGLASGRVRAGQVRGQG